MNKKYILIGLAVLLVFVATFFFLTRRAPHEEPTPTPGEATTTTDGTPVTTAHAGWKTYSDTKNGFEISYPPEFSVNDQYLYQALGPGKDSKGVSFTVPVSMTTGTNLASDTHVSVENNTISKNCLAKDFLGDQILKEDTITKNGIEYSFVQGGGVGAGNFYAETIYATHASGHCFGVRFFIHSSNIQNYPAGTVKEFDEVRLVDVFEEMLATFKPTK